MPDRTPGGRWIPEAEAIDRYDLRNLPPVSNYGYPGVLFFDGNLELDGALDTWLDGAAHQGRATRPCLVIIDGSLRATEALQLPDDPRVCLLVRGDLNVPSVELGYGQVILVEGNARIAGAVIATATSGEFHVTGVCEVPFVLNNGDNVVKAGVERWREVVFREPRDLEPVCVELGIEGLDFDDPDCEVEVDLVDKLVSQQG